MTRVLGSVWAFLAAALVLVGAVWWLAPSSSPTAQRIAHLETLVKCPACADLSVAESTAPSALAVREEIRSAVADGQSDTQILTTLEGQYGTAILLSPRGSPLDDLLFAVPVAVVVAGLFAYGRLVRRRS